MSEGRRCACPCNKPLPPNARANRHYIDERHKDRAYRQRLRGALSDAGLPASLSLKVVQATTGSGNRRADGRSGSQRRQTRRRDGVSIYLRDPANLAPVIAALEYAQEHLGGPDLEPAIEDVRRARARHERRKR